MTSRPDRSAPRHSAGFSPGFAWQRLSSKGAVGIQHIGHMAAAALHPEWLLRGIAAFYNIQQHGQQVTGLLRWPLPWPPRRDGHGPTHSGGRCSAPAWQCRSSWVVMRMSVSQRSHCILLGRIANFLPAMSIHGQRIMSCLTGGELQAVHQRGEKLVIATAIPFCQRGSARCCRRRRGHGISVRFCVELIWVDAQPHCLPAALAFSAGNILASQPEEAAQNTIYQRTGIHPPSLLR